MNKAQRFLSLVMMLHAYRDYIINRGSLTNGTTDWIKPTQEVYNGLDRDLLASLKVRPCDFDFRNLMHFKVTDAMLNALPEELEKMPEFAFLSA